MAEKPNGLAISLREQIIEDIVSGLTITIERTPDGEGRIRIRGDIPFHNRDFAFSQDGQLVGTGTGLCTHCTGPASWLRLAD